jgi:hypothetical protein
MQSVHSCGTEDTTSTAGTVKHSAAGPTAGGCQILATHITSAFVHKFMQDMERDIRLVM